MCVCVLLLFALFGLQVCEREKYRELDGEYTKNRFKLVIIFL